MLVTQKQCQVSQSALAAKMYEECMKISNPMNSTVSQPLLEARMALLKPPSSQHGYLNHDHCTLHSFFLLDNWI